MPPQQPEAWRVVRLPDLQPADAAPARDGARVPSESAAPIQMRWYRFRYAPEGPWPTSVALYLPRLLGLGAAVLVRTEDGWQPVFDNQTAAKEQWVRPFWALIPSALIDASRARGLEIVLALPVVAQQPFSVPSAYLGAKEEIEPLQRRRWTLQIGVPQALGLMLVVLGFFSLSLWLRKRDEPAYLLFALLTQAWLLRNLHYHLEVPRSEWGEAWFWWMSNAALSWVLLLVFLFALRHSRQRFRGVERAVLAVVLLCSVVTLPWWHVSTAVPVLQHVFNAGLGLGCALFLLALAWPGPWPAAWFKGGELPAPQEGAAASGRVESRVIVVSLWVCVLLGLHDLMLMAGWAWPEHLYVLPYATLISVATFLYAVQRRFLGAMNEVESLNQALGERLAQQSRELTAQYEKLREAERQQALLLERQRLMQDMHDGLGSALLSAMVAVEQGSMDQDKVVEVLRECVDDLRLVIDSLEPVAHDLVALLATMRYRLGKRLQAGGLMLEWDVQDLPMLDWLEPPDALHVLRLMQEALSNVLKHARATRARMVTRNHGHYVEIRVEDDGDGFDPAQAPKGRGLKSQQRRAQRLGGVVRIDSSPGQGTRLSLRLPVKRAQAPGQQEAAESRTI